MDIINYQISYPIINLWTTDGCNKINWINRDDFREKLLLEKLDLNNNPLAKSFGITDIEEIRKRQNIMRFFLINHSEISSFMENIWLDSFDIPSTNQQVFIDYFKEPYNNKFQNIINQFLGKIQQCTDIPEELQKLVDFLVSTKKIIFKSENHMSKKIKEELLKATYVEGILTYRLSVSDHNKIYGLSHCAQDDEKFIGWKKYGYGINQNIKDRDVVPDSLMRFIDFLDLDFVKIMACNYEKKIKKNIETLRYSSLIIDELPIEIVGCIKKFLLKDLENKHLPKIFGEHLAQADLKVYFRYKHSKLYIKIIDMAGISKDINKQKETTIFSEANHFPGYSDSEKKRILQIQAELEKNCYEKQTWRALASSMNKINHFIPGICDDLIEIDCPEVVENIGWASIDGILEKNNKLRKQFEIIVYYRNFLKSIFTTFADIYLIASKLLRKSNIWKKALSFPIITNSEQVVSFKKLTPIHLQDVYESIDIEKLPPLNGNIFMFTGQNAGGKTTTEEALVNMIYLAQSGLPIFAEDFRLNIKDNIGLVFIERGQGSTFELLIRKIKSIIEFLQSKNNHNHTLIILDELGTGTQGDAGKELGIRVLNEIIKHNCSIIASTQLTGLAIYAQANLAASCFQFHQYDIEPGIGSGETDLLMKKIGLDALLTK